MDFRIGHGYDVHQLVVDRPLIIGGVAIPFDKGLLGHSDADVLAHAVTDALLGALCLGDIGNLFPDKDPAYKNADSMKLLAQCISLMDKQGYRLGNLDATILAQAPKLAPYIPDMQKNLATAFSAERDQVNVKATTEEYMGFTGAGQGIAAHCVLILQKK